MEANKMALKTFANAQLLAKLAAALLVSDLDYAESEQVIKQLIRSGKRALHVFYHGHALSWIPMAAVAIAKTCELGGGHRRPFAVFHRMFFDLPGLSIIPRTVANSERVANIDELITILN